MAVRIAQESSEDRLAQMIADPDTYFSEARARTRVEIDKEIERERQAGKR
jgi:hypothetical protein